MRLVERLRGPLVGVRGAPCRAVTAAAAPAASAPVRRASALADIAELVRLPAALSVPGDAWAGAAHARQDGGWAMPVASITLYWAGMAFNDVCDAGVDARERPERPIPSGRVSARGGLTVAAGLAGAGVAVAGALGGLRIAVPLAGTIALYDAAAKDAPAGPLVMASARGLDVLLGAAADPAAAALPAAAVWAHTAGLTVLSRGEVRGASPRVARAVTAGTVAIAATTAAAAFAPGGVGAGRRAAAPRARGQQSAPLAAAALATAYGITVGRAQARAGRDPSAPVVRAATGAGIGGMTLLQAAWVARRGRLVHAAALVLARPAFAAATRRLSAT